jgi:hypothetical protein
MNIEFYKQKSKLIKRQYKDDFAIQYLCNSIARTKDVFNNIANISLLNEHLNKSYNIQFVE